MDSDDVENLEGVDDVLAELGLVPSFDDRLKDFAGDETVWSVGAMAKVTIKLKDGSYKKVAIQENDPELFFRGTYKGKRGEPIYVFEPVDTRPFEQVEFPEKDVGRLVKGFEAAVLERLNVGADTLARARAKVNVLVQRQASKRAADAKAAERASAADHYAGNPLWGAF